MIWFSSDFHFQHTNIAGPKVSKWKNGYRDFNNVKEMDEKIIENLNKYIKHDDILYFLGDFAFGDHRKIPELRNRINCNTIHLLKGNHDNDIDKYKKEFSSINDVLHLTINGRNYFLSHYSHRVWNKSHQGCIHLYAHSHDSIPDYGKSMDIGIDVAYRLYKEYRPFSLSEIIEIMDKKEIGVLDHHAIKNPN